MDNKRNARVFAITQEEADNVRDVVSGTIMIHKVPYYVLFDCGDTNSFMSKRFAKKLGRKLEKLVEPFKVTTPASTTIETCEIHRDRRINISCQTFNADLIQLVMVDFKAILGMDWVI